jgi:hypothetical protein
MPERRKSEVSTSIIIPCVYKHFVHIENLLNAYKKQSALPNEIIISLSEAYRVDKSTIEKVENEKWPFRVKIVKSDDRQSAGLNRNIAAENATCDVLICQDADDLPHSQRVEIIKYFFKKYKIDHLVHQVSWEIKCLSRAARNFDEYLESFIKFRPKQIKYYRIKSKKEFLKYYEKISCITLGCIAISKRVFKKVKWPTDFICGEDKIFTEKVCEKFGNTFLIKAKLLTYRNSLSECHNGKGPE